MSRKLLDRKLETGTMKPLLSYLDFREYLRDFYKEKKAESGFSFRDFAKAAGFTSPVYIKLVIDGKANLAPASMSKLCDAVGLKKEERKYFKALVRFGQANTIESKIRCLQELKTLLGSLRVNELSDDQFEYFSKWYHPVIKELLDMMVFDGDYQNLANLVNPPISEKEARESVELLEKLQLIRRDERGQFIATSKFLTTEGLTTGTLAVKNVQKTMAHLAAQAIDNMPKEARDISGVSISISSKSLDAIREEILQCRRRIFEIAAKDTECDSVYRVNLHLFPISENVPGERLKKNVGEAL